MYSINSGASVIHSKQSGLLTCLLLIFFIGGCQTATPNVTSEPATPIPELETTNSLLYLGQTPSDSELVDYWPTKGWRTSTPEEQGMDSEQLVRMFQYIQDQDINLHSVLIVRNGYVVTDAYIHPFSQDSKHIIHSAAKSVVSALVGIAIDQGYIEGVGQPVLDIFPGRRVAQVDADKERMALEHLLTMATGLACEEEDLRTIREMTQSEDWVQYMLDLPMEATPGTRFEYCNGASLVLSAIVQEATGMSSLDFAEEHLFGPLGISDIDWISSPRGVTIGYGRLFMKPRDMAKIGYLYLNGGLWDGQQVVSSAWVEASTRQYFSTSQAEGYGYQWWVEDSGVYKAVGYVGQSIIVVPEKDMVVVFTGGLRGQDSEGALDLLLDYFIIPATDSSAPLPENPAGVALLESQIQALANPDPQPVPPLPEITQSISGRRYALEDDTFAWRSFSLSFQKDQAWVTLFFEEDTLELPIGLDGVYCNTPVDQPAFFTLLYATYREPDIERIIQLDRPESVTGSVALKGFWRDNNTFVVHQQMVGMDERLELILTFDEAEVDVREQVLARGRFQRTHGTLFD